LALGLSIAFSGTVTFNSAAETHGLCRQVPSIGMLIETDCPSWFRSPRRGSGRTSQPFVVSVAERWMPFLGRSHSRRVGGHQYGHAVVFGLPVSVTPNVYDVLLVLAARALQLSTSAAPYRAP